MMRHHDHRNAWAGGVLATCLLLFPILALGQAVSGYISGSVVDSSGLPVPGATVILINEATAERRTQ